MMNYRPWTALLILAFTASAQAFAQTPKAAQTPPPAVADTPAGNNNSAASTKAAASNVPVVSQETAATTRTTKNLYCPEVGKLMKKEMFWGAPGGWKSYSQSFVDVIDSFSGAQWVGVNVGKMLCVYKGKGSFEFPVVLQNDTLTPVPEGQKWVKQSGGYINCLSGDVLDCPFKFEETTTDIKNVYKELDFFKGKSDYLKDDSSRTQP
ncbi:MAG: T4SS-associated protein EirA [Gammaproteobacteria bacterium]|nr:T4SS-associated protein EirA [Gammaproteobacteria bacterium]